MIGFKKTEHRGDHKVVAVKSPDKPWNVVLLELNDEELGWAYDAAEQAQERKRAYNEHKGGWSTEGGWLALGLVPQFLADRYPELMTSKGQREFFKDCPMFMTRDVGAERPKIIVP